MPRSISTPDPNDSLRDITEQGKAMPRAPKGALDKGQLRDLIAFLDGADTQIDAGGAPAPQDIEIARMQVLYADLESEVKRSCEYSEYSSSAFISEASSHGFSPYQWAAVRLMVAQSEGKVTPSSFTPDGSMHLIVKGNLSLSNSRALTTLPQHLTVQGDLLLTDCIALRILPSGLTVQGSLSLRSCTAIAALPTGLTVGGFLDLTYCRSAVKAQGEQLDTDGKVGRLYLE